MFFELSELGNISADQPAAWPRWSLCIARSGSARASLAIDAANDEPSGVVFIAPPRLAERQRPVE
jgi:hypothetical protein